VTNPIDAKENDEHALDFSLHLSLISVCPVPSMLFEHPNACLIIARVSIARFSRSAQNLMLFLCKIHPQITSDQIHDSK
jgi:hypothetical protein